MTEQAFTGTRARKAAPEPGSTRDQILAAAARVLRERGLVGMTTRNIARQAGLADGTLYVHFQHKEDLILATVEAELPRFSAAMHTEAAESRSLQAAVEDIVRAAVQYSTALVPISGALFSDPDLLARLQTTLTERHAGPQLLYRQVADFIAAEQQRGRVKARLDPLGAATLVLGPCFQYAFLRHLVGAEPFAMSEDQFVTDQVATLMVCLARRRGQNGSTKDRPRKGAHR